MKRALAPERTIGTMLRFVRTRGFAFVGDATGHEFFVHRSGCEPPALYDSLTDGAVVSFQTLPTAKGQRAWDLRLATAEEVARVPTSR